MNHQLGGSLMFIAAVLKKQGKPSKAMGSLLAGLSNFLEYEINQEKFAFVI